MFSSWWKKKEKGVMLRRIDRQLAPAWQRGPEDEARGTAEQDLKQPLWSAPCGRLMTGRAAATALFG